MPTPQLDEFVIATVKKIMPYGAFCTLEEYPGTEAFVHISEVAPRWIKNIHEFLHEGQKVVARIYRLVPEKNQIDLSLKRVSEAEKKRKLEAVKRSKRGLALFNVVQKSMKMGEVKKKQSLTALSQSFEDLLSAFETALEDGPDPLIKAGIEKEIAEQISEIAKKSLKIKRAEVKAILSLVSYEPNGIDLIRKALSGLSTPQGSDFSLLFLGSPKYQLKVSSPDFKHSEKALESIVSQIEKNIKGTESVFNWAKAEA